MSVSLKKYLLEHYKEEWDNNPTTPQPFIQIDDQDSHDNFQTFCNIFITFKKNRSFELEITGKFPITPEIEDICEIYKGYANIHRKRAVLHLDTDKIAVINDLANILKSTSHLGDTIDNPDWSQISARTVGSLKRVARILKGYNELVKNKKNNPSKVLTLFFLSITNLLK